MGERDIEWLSKQDAFEIGVKSERERIIDLLEENLYNDDDCRCDGCKVARYVVELIKGENK